MNYSELLCWQAVFFIYKERCGSNALDTLKKALQANTSTQALDELRSFIQQEYTAIRLEYKARIDETFV